VGRRAERRSGGGRIVGGLSMIRIEVLRNRIMQPCE
jgi:hypothetical protein